MPSIAKLLGEQVPASYLGDRRSDLFELAGERNGDASGDGYAFAEWRSWTQNETDRIQRRNRSYDFTGLDRDLLCVRDRRFKLVRTSDGSESLFDLAQDGGESENVAAAWPEDQRRLRDRLDAAVASWREWDDEAVEPSEMSEQEQAEIEQRLAELGYI